MAKLNNAFDSDQYGDMSGFEPLPVDKDYVGVITNSDVKATQAGDGTYVSIEITVQGGEYDGRKLWPNYNIVNKNPVTEEIAKKAIATLARAIGKPKFQDTEDLHGTPFGFNVKTIPAKGNYQAKSEPTKYFALENRIVPDDPSDDSDPWSN